MSLLDVIPGYRQAIRREADVRSQAFLGLNETLALMEVRPLTLRHFLMLEGLGSPFIVGGSLPTMRDCVNFVWCVWPGFNQRGNGRWRCIRACKRAGYFNLVTSIRAYVRDALMDSPPSPESKGFSPGYYCWATSYVAVFAETYHWSEEHVLDMPMKRIFQYLRLMERKSNSKSVLFNPSDKVRSAWLRERNRTKVESN